MIYTNDESSFNSKELQKYYEENTIEHIITRTHAPVAERAIRTFKDMLYKRIEHDEEQGKDNIQWNDYIFEITFIFNNRMVVKNTGMTPVQAMKKENELKVKLNLELSAKRNRKYPEIKTGDKVRIYTKKGRFDKERVPVWSKTIHEVKEISSNNNQMFYKVSDYTRPLMRHEILSVN